MDFTLPEKYLRVTCDLDDYYFYHNLPHRKLYLCGTIVASETDELGFSTGNPTATIINRILTYNEEDRKLPPDQPRKPIFLYINSPGGDAREGFALISAMELSKTPIYTVNIGQWSSMSFLIGIAGKKRFSLPYMTFLMHDGSSFAFGTTSKVQDQVEFSKRFEQEIVKKHVLKYSNMKAIDYDALTRVEVYMLPEDALERGFIDEIVTDIDTIL